MARQLTLEIAVEKTRAEAALREVERELKSVADAAMLAGKATDEQAKKFDRLSWEANNLKKVVKGYNDEQRETKKVTDAGAAATGLLTSALLRYVSASAVGMAIKGTADWADRLEELHKVTGLSITTLQKLDQVTKLNGTSVEALSRAFSTMQDRVAGGDKSAVKAFERLGLSFEAFQRMRPDDQMENLAIAVMKIEDPMTRANVVTDLFGRTGVQLIPTLEAIAAGMDDITVASERNVKAMGQLSDWWETLKGRGAILLTDTLGPWIRMWEDLTLGADGFRGRLASLTTFIATMMQPALLGHIDTLRDYFKVLSGGDLGTPKVPNAPGLEQPAGGGMLPTWEEMLRIEKEINAQLREQGVFRADAPKKVNDTTAALRDQLSVLEMQSQKVQEIGAFFGIKPKQFGWEDFAPTAPAPGMPGAGTWNTNAILAQYMGLNGPTVPGRGPSFWRRQMGNLAGQQAGWRQQNFGSLEGWTNSAMDWGYQLQDISENGDPVWNATNVRGRGNRAAKGALKGAEIGGRFGGPYGAMGGAAIGALIGAFRNPMFEDIFNRIAKNFGVTVTDEMAKEIEKRAKTEFGGNRQAAEIASLGGIIQAGGGINEKNVGTLTARLHDAFSMYGTGAFNKDQLTKTLDESFGYFAEYYDNIGGLADQNFRRIIEMSREAGVESAAVTQYVSQQVSTAASGLELYLENATVKTQSAASGVGAAAVLLFDEIRKGPDGLRGAIEQIGPIFLTLQEQMAAAGFSGSEAFTQILSDVQAFTVEGVAQATTAVDGLNMTLEGLYNSTLLNAESFTGLSRAMTDEIEVARQALIAQGKDGDAALRLNAAGLQTIWELQKQFGWAVDESTQAMLDQAEAQGLIGASFQDTNRQMLDALQTMAGVLEDIRDHMLGLGDDAADVADVIQNEFDRIEVPDWSYGGGGPGSYTPGQSEGYAMGGVVKPWRYAANGLFVPRGTDTVPAMLTPGEGVLSRRGMRALGRLNAGDVGGGHTFNITIQAETAEGGEAAGQAFMDLLRKRGVKLASYA